MNKYEHNLKSITDAVSLLNEMLKLDKLATEELIDNAHVAVNDNLANHPKIMVNKHKELGLLGFLNGLFADVDDGTCIAAYYDDNNHINEFGLYNYKD